MMFSSLRRIVLVRVASVLSGWLHGISAQLPQAEPAAPIPPAAPRSAASDPYRPAPPAHWVELVQQYVPQLLEPAADFAAPAEPDVKPSPAQPTGSDRKGTPDDFQPLPEGNIVDYRTGTQKPPTSPQTNLRPAQLMPSAPRPVDVPQHRSTPPRPLRLAQVSTRPLESVEIDAHSSETHAETPDLSLVATDAPEVEPLREESRPFASEQVAPPFVQTTIRPVDMGQTGRLSRLFSVLHLRRHKPTPALPVDLPVRRSADAPAQPVRAIPTQTREAPPLHFTQPSFEQQRIRKIDTSLPNGASVPTIHTNMGQAPQVHQGRTTIPQRPSIPSQTVYRPTLPSLNLQDVTPDRWPSLPDEPAETQRDPAAERQRRERLKREQEGGAWSE